MSSGLSMNDSASEADYQSENGQPSPSVERILCVYENQPLSTTSTYAVPRLLAQLVEHLARVNPSTEIIATSPGAEEIAGTRSVRANLGLATRARCRLSNSRLVRAVHRRQGMESTIPYQLARSALKPFAADANEQTVVIAATMSVAILAKELMPKARVVYWIQGMPRLGQEILASRAVAAADAIVAPSKAMYTDLFQLICRDRFAAPVWVIPNTIDRSMFKPESTETLIAARNRLGLGKDDVAIMHIGRAPEKGLQIAKTALALGRFDKNVVLISAGGSTKSRRRIHDRAEVFEIGRVTPRELNQIYRVCHLGLVPSVWWENCPLALIEMMSVGLCPIGSRVGGIPEMIEHRKSGLIIDAPNDASAWAAAIETLLRDDVLRDRLADEAIRSVEKRFNSEQSISQWLQVIRTVVATS